MKKRTAITIAATIWSIALFSLFPVSSASAQYEPILPEPPNCADYPAPEVTIEGDVIIITFAPESTECVDEVVVQIDVILYQGPIPPDRRLELPMPEDEPENDVVLTTVILIDETTKVVRTPIPRDGVPQPVPPTLPLAQDDPTGNSPTGTSPQRRATPAPPLALTGAPISLQASIGAALIGGGGLLLLAARHSRSREPVIFL